MNAMTNSILRSLVCGCSGAVITVVLGLSFVNPRRYSRSAWQHRGRGCESCPDGKGTPVGQSEPAVLVD